MTDNNSSLCNSIWSYLCFPSFAPEELEGTWKIEEKNVIGYVSVNSCCVSYNLREKCCFCGIFPSRCKSRGDTCIYRFGEHYWIPSSCCFCCCCNPFCWYIVEGEPKSGE